MAYLANLKFSDPGFVMRIRMGHV